MKQPITKEEYYQLMGLLTLAKKHNKFIVDLSSAARLITGETGHTDDAIYCDYGIDELLEKTKIVVEK